MNYRQIEEIDLYHSGRMTPKEAAAFEQKLAADPSLKAESDLQAHVIDGLKDYRKSQLKSRLDAIDVAPGWMEFVQQSTLIKSFGGVAVATLIGSGIYFYAEPTTDNSVEGETIVIDAPQYENEQFIFELGSEVQNDVALESIDKKSIQSTKSTEEDNSSIQEKIVASTEALEKPANEKEVFTLSFDAPDAKDVRDEEALKTTSLDELPEEAVSVTETSPIDVETEITNSIKVKYKYYDGKLFLSGDFDIAPYEILEINSANGRRIYVKYLDKYYKVGVTDRLTDLPEVTDVKVIDELKLLRQNK